MSGRGPLTDIHGVVQLEMVESQGDRLVGEGEFGYCGRPTDNGRIYKRDLIEREIERRQDAIESRGMFGHLDHPDHGQTKLKETSHIVTGLRVENDGRVWGRLEVLEGKDHGDELAALIRNNCRLGISSRGVGSVKKTGEGNVMVQEDYRLLAYDVVADPASDGAHPEFGENHQYERTESGVYAPEGDADGGVFEVGFDSGGPQVSVPSDIDDGGGTIDESEATQNDTTDEETAMPDDNIETVEDLREEYPDLVDDLTESAAESVRDEVSDQFEARLEEEREKLESQFASNIEQFRNEIGESDESDGVSADRLMERFREEVVPELRPEAADEGLVEENQRLQKRCQSVRDQLVERDNAIADLQTRLEEERMGRIFAEHLHRVPLDERDAFESMVGQASDYDSVDQFRERISAVVEDFKRTGRYADAHVDDLFESERRREQLESDLETAEQLLDEANATIRELRADNEKLSEAVADRDDILAEANDRIEQLESYEQEVEELEALLVDARDEIRERDAKIEEWSDLLSEAKSEIDRKARRLEEAELKAYKRKKVIGARNPNERLRKLDEARTKEDVDSVIQELNNRDRTRKEPPSRHGNADPDNVVTEGVKENIRERVNEASQMHEQNEQSGSPDQGGSPEQGGGESVPTRVEESAPGAPAHNGGPDGGAMPTGGGNRQIPGLSPDDLEQEMQQL